MNTVTTHTPTKAAAYRRELKPMPLRIAESQHIRLGEARDRSGISVQEHIRRAIDLYLAVIEKEAIELGMMAHPNANAPTARPLRTIQPTQRVTKR